MEFLIVSGLSGAGKSTVMSILEDSGYFCVDNLPPVLIPKFAEMCMGGAYDQVAMVCDIRGGMNFNPLFEALDVLGEMQFPYKIVFVDAETKTIIKRYKETRRSHPLMTEGKDLALTDAVELERSMMEPVREKAHHIITTTDLPTKKLRDQVLDLFAPSRKKKNEMSISVTSFGFKYGVPLEADLVFDVRFLPNPFYVEELRGQTGLDAPVRDYVFAYGETEEFMSRLKDMVAFLLPHYMEEGKSALVIAIGCTGGHHRSVAITHALAEYIRELGYSAGENHRDMTRV